MADEPKDLFKLLSVGRDASPDDIKKAFRKLALRYHPDIPRSSADEERLKKINAAYRVLRDPNKREQYEKELENRERLEQRRREQARRRQARAPTEEAADLFREHVRKSYAGGGTFFPPPFSGSGSVGTAPTPSTPQPQAKRWYELFDPETTRGKLCLLFASSAFAVGCVAVTGWLATSLEASASDGDHLLAALALLGVGLGGFMGSVAGALVAVFCLVSLLAMALRRFWRVIGLGAGAALLAAIIVVNAGPHRDGGAWITDTPVRSKWLVTGSRIGSIRAQMSPARARAIIGPPLTKERDRFEGYFRYAVPGGILKALVVYYGDPQGAITGLTTNSPRFMTKEHLGVGSSISAVASMYEDSRYQRGEAYAEYVPAMVGLSGGDPEISSGSKVFRYCPAPCEPGVIIEFSTVGDSPDVAWVSIYSYFEP